MKAILSPPSPSFFRQRASCRCFAPWLFVLIAVAFALTPNRGLATDFLVDTAGDDSFDGNSLALERADGGGLSLREAVSLANQNGGVATGGELDGDTISFSDLVFAVSQTIAIGSEIAITDDLAIDGSILDLGGNPAFKIILDAGSNDRIFKVDTGSAPGLSAVDLTQLVFRNGAVAGNGGAIEVVAGATLNLRSGAEITDSVATDGGGVYNAGTLEVSGARLANNAANGVSGSGGGIFNAAGASLSVSGSTFEANVANRAGGGIEDQAGAGKTTTLDQVVFLNNNAGVLPAAASPGNGGGVHITGASDLSISGGSASGNVAAREGGAFWNGAGVMTLNGVTVSNNIASGAAADDGGGGIFNNGGTLSLVDTTLSGNIADGASGSGGGLFSTTGDVTLSGNTVVSANTANRAGGGIEVIDGKLTLSSILLGGTDASGANVAGPTGTASPGNGGGLHVSGTCAVTISGGQVRFNTAAREGGGLWNQAGATMTLSDGATISENTASGDAADDGGGGLFNNAGTVVVDGTAAVVTITNNTADGVAGSGGGILTVGGVVNLTDATISGNVANRAGGGIEDASGAGLGLIVSNSLLASNVAGASAASASPGNGGALHITGPGSATFTGGTISGNTAFSEGGGLWNGSGTLTVDGSTVTGNTASGAEATNGGGGLFNAGGELVVKNGATISNNIADGASGSGGGIFNDVAGTLTIADSALTGNRANRAGGGIEDNSGTGGGLVLTRVTLTSNNAGAAPATAAPGNGGGIHISGAGDSSLTDCQASQNVAAREGGAYWNGAGVMTIDGGLIDANSADGAAANDGGGGVFNNGGTVTIQNDAVISNNVASGTSGSGGGILNFGTVALSEVRLEGNRANRAGGGLEDASGAGLSVTLIDVDFVSNNAGVAPASATPGNGGAVHITGAGSLQITRGSAAGNVAAAEGGAYWNGSGVMTVDGTSISDNVASGAGADQGGGGFFNAGGTITIENATLAGNVADGSSGSGGGVLNDAGGSLSISASALDENRANRAGGGIEDNSGSGLGVVLSNVDFSMNKAGVAPASAAPGNGGAIHISGNGDITISGGNATANLAAKEGGAYWNGSGDMTVRGGVIDGNRASGAAADDGGGGLFNNGGTLLIENGAIVRNNFADGTSGSGGGIFNEGGLLTVTGSTITRNVANRAGGGIEDNAGVAVILSETTLDDNTAGPGGFASPGNGGAFHVTGAGNVSLTSCVVSGNVAGNEGGGLWNSGVAVMTVLECTISGGMAPDGGGLFQQSGNGNLTVINSTVSGNSATNGGGFQNEGGELAFLHATVAANSANTGGGGNIVNGTVKLTNTVIANNTASSGSDLNGPIAMAQNSLLENGGGASGIADGVSGNIVGADPQLGPLADNGGATLTHRPATSSPLVDKGNNTAAGALSSDQRGAGFARLIGGRVDIGAIEVFVLTYADWAAANFGPETPQDQRQANDNPDGDDSDNGYEYLRGTDPEVGGDPSPVSGRYKGDTLVIRYTRQKAIPAGIDEAELSDDLIDWIRQFNPMRTTVSLTAELEEVTLTLPVGDALRKFGRIVLLGL